MGFEDGFIADGSFIDPISDNWKACNNINIAYKPHNRALLRSNIKMDHLYRSMKDRASWCDYETHHRCVRSKARAHHIKLMDIPAATRMGTPATS